MAYSFDVRINACIEPDGTLKVYYASSWTGDTGLDDSWGNDDWEAGFDLVINEPNWSGGPVSNTIIPCNTHCGANSVTCSVIAARNVGENIELDIDYSVYCTTTYDHDDNFETPPIPVGTCTGSTTVVITPGGSCPANLATCT